MKKKAIVVTDGDEWARKTIQIAAASLGLHTISDSGGNPTPLSGKQISELVLAAPVDVVVVMFDDRGKGGVGKGETALRDFAKESDIEIIGALAVASNCDHPDEVEVLFSIDADKQRVDAGVDKEGHAHTSGKKTVFGDTIGVLNQLKVPIIGIGDIGKMQCRDNPVVGAPITTKALQTILQLHDAK